MSGVSTISSAQQAMDPTSYCRHSN
jgi:hypothetical protein